ncbi:ribosomal protein L7/L12 [Aureibaculum sp. 2210JD6-5]|uniref:ribosomal protein L7/L12 n=1 Tax=Aureibaculum sp. 2210JD6-5 TaxID=3103957 RepID=UPI002AAE7509|nr:ribosomal protein L7/L12 [Aureibaculum sp. 2210JD6-5]MDY7395166.1 ribosomal protein L7/L12 [Aureibaculum sp. 2210JD6-5]
MNNQIIINNIVLDKAKLLRLIDKNKKIQAVKYVKDETNLGLKSCKDIVDNLSENPNYYDGEENTIMAAPTLKKRNVIQKNIDRETKRSHIIKNRPFDIKNAFIVFLLIVIFILVFLLTK